MPILLYYIISVVDGEVVGVDRAEMDTSKEIIDDKAQSLKKQIFGIVDSNIRRYVVTISETTIAKYKR